MHAPNIFNPLTRKYMSVPTKRVLIPNLEERVESSEAGSNVSFYTGAAELDCDRVQRSPRVK